MVIKAIDIIGKRTKIKNELHESILEAIRSSITHRKNQFNGQVLSLLEEMMKTGIEIKAGIFTNGIYSAEKAIQKGKKAPLDFLEPNFFHTPLDIIDLAAHQIDYPALKLYTLVDYSSLKY